MRRYAAKDRVEILAEHLKEQFIPHPALDSREVASHQEQIERRIQEFLSTPVPPLLGDYYVSLAETTVVSFLESRSFFVAVEDTTLDLPPIRAGVSHANCSSPCLYSVFTDDISTLAGQLQD
ncbi:hypothetical protein EVAR_81493_1 [Eumeta japonica]|uniref:Uncharacterized protein n=1 Tax=Eumeta variegata TaxID=151549 RepID=A0A4C1W3Q2_EUMVA|nr:hypothetical protein EVAR_81493_1 [Eumeta japonica]